jgi:CheY-specific phosphatase CheX
MAMPAAERDRMIDAVTRVAERSLYAFAEAVPVELMPQTIDGGWHVASVSFMGPFSGRMTMTVPAVLGRQICSAFLGDDEVADDVAVRDLVGEFANMTCGTWLTAQHASACFDLTHPDVIDAEVAPSCDIAFVINELPVTLRLEMGAGLS